MDTTTGSESNSNLNKSVAELNLSARGKKAAERLGCTTVGDLANRALKEFKELKNCGAGTIDEIRRHLAGFGLKILDDKP